MNTSRKASNQNGSPIITHTMSVPEIALRLADHGCSDMTNEIDLSSASQFPIANGGYGDIYRGCLHNYELVAIKTLRLQVHSTEEGAKHLKRAARELHTWAKCDHPNVLKLLGLAVFRDQIGMVSPWMENGNLPSYLARYPNADRISICSQISNGLEYLHQRGIIHGDLKGLNIFFSSGGNPVLADFGNATLKDQSFMFTTTTANKSISHRWAAPELFQGEASHTAESDIYALGMTILETITGSVPYSKKNDFAVMFAVVVAKETPERPKETTHLNEEHGGALWALLLSCWSNEPKNRPDATSVANRMRELAHSRMIMGSQSNVKPLLFDNNRRSDDMKVDYHNPESEEPEEDDDDSSTLEISTPIDFDIVHSLRRFTATVEGQATVARDDALFLMDDSNNYWWLVRVLKSQEIGYVPAENIEEPNIRLARFNKRRNMELTKPTLQDQIENTRLLDEWPPIRRRYDPSIKSAHFDRVFTYPPATWDADESESDDSEKGEEDMVDTTEDGFDFGCLVEGSVAKSQSSEFDYPR